MGNEPSGSMPSVPRMAQGCGACFAGKPSFQHPASSVGAEMPQPSSIETRFAEASA
jgi:hypothetical protein